MYYALRDAYDGLCVVHDIVYCILCCVLCVMYCACPCCVLGFMLRVWCNEYYVLRGCALCISYGLLCVSRHVLYVAYDSCCIVYCVVCNVYFGFCYVLHVVLCIR